MKKQKRFYKYLLSSRALARNKKEVKRKYIKHKKFVGKLKFLNDVRLNALLKNKNYRKLNQNKNRRNFKPPIPVFINKIAPTFFTLKYEHCIPVIEFINDLKESGRQGKHINIVMDDVIEIGEGAIAMLLSVINELSNHAIIVKGSKPNNEVVKGILENSGFFKYIRTIITAKNSNSKNTILRTGDNKTPSSELAAEVRKSMDTVWGNSARCPRLFGGIIEMVRNTCDHAFKKEEGITWHFGLSHFEEGKLVKFSFVDNGKGIIKTFTNSILKQVLNLFSDNTDILTTAFKDGIESRTGLSWRGKGLPTIFELSTDKIISRLVVITNEVYIDFDRNIKVTLPVSYSGTYYYWEVDSNCIKSYFE